MLEKKEKLELLDIFPDLIPVKSFAEITAIAPTQRKLGGFFVSPMGFRKYSDSEHYTEFSSNENKVGVYDESNDTSFELNLNEVVGKIAGSKKFRFILSGSDKGDLIIGNTAGKYLQWDESSGTLFTTGTIIDGTSTIGGRLASTIASAINSSGEATAVLNGIITETKIANDAVSSPKIIAGAIIGEKIAIGAVTADKISVTSLAAINANLGTITAGTINASLVNVYNINADNISTGTLVGRTIKTATTNERVELNATEHDMRFYDLNGNLRGIIDSAEWWGNAYHLEIYASGNDGRVVIKATDQYGTFYTPVMFYASGNQGRTWFLGDVTIDVNLVLKVLGKMAMGDFTPSISLALGDSDTGFNWITDGHFKVYANNVPVMDVKSGGVGFNIESPSAKLHVVGGAQDSAIIANSTGGYKNDWEIGWDGGLATWDICAASIKYSSLVQRSDRNFKKNIKYFDDINILDKILELKPVFYRWKDKRLPKKENYGFIAQDIEKIFPLLVESSKSGEKSLNYIQIIPLLVKALQEIKLEIDSIKKKEYFVKKEEE